jgi:hypothetical protein
MIGITTVLVWVLVTTDERQQGPTAKSTISYSPPVATAQACETLKGKVILGNAGLLTNRCVQIEMAVPYQEMPPIQMRPLK